MRVLRILTSKQLPCGCLAGVYELYSGEVIAIVDAPDGSCVTHRTGQQVDEMPRVAEAANQPHAGE
jgi:hypothetical protein